MAVCFSPALRFRAWAHATFLSCLSVGWSSTDTLFWEPLRARCECECVLRPLGQAQSFSWPCHGERRLFKSDLFLIICVAIVLTANVGWSSGTSWQIFFFFLSLSLWFCAAARVCTSTHVCLRADCLCLCQWYNPGTKLRCSLNIQQCFTSRWVLRIESSALIFRAVIMRHWGLLLLSFHFIFYFFLLSPPLRLPMVKPLASGNVPHISLSPLSWTRRSKYQSLPPALAVYTRRRESERGKNLLRTLLFIQDAAL